MFTPNTKLAAIPKITPKYQKLLDKLGLQTVQDLLLYFPFRYDDFSKVVPISQDYVGQTVTIAGIIQKKKLARIFRRKMTIAEIVIQPASTRGDDRSSTRGGDENNTPLKAVWFNQPYILESLPEGAAVRLSGKLEFKGRTFSMVNPAWERAERTQTNTGILVPVYPETKGLTSKWLRWQLKPLLESAQQMEDTLPYDIRQRLNLYDIYTALQQIHFPENQEKLLRAQKRFAFQEMFLVQLKTLQVKQDWEQNNSLAIPFDEELIKNFVSTLPFKLTNAQRKASFEILKDLEKPKPMNRLLNGDVGSGKTIVAAIAALQAMQAGFQVAIMAPTEVLAKQHFESFSKLFAEYDFNVALLTNSYKKLNGADETRPDLLQNIRKGSIELVIGTHAIIQKDVKFENLALIVIDEQHRFGVAQRALLQQETMEIKDGVAKTIPHLLTMTATPIPRTLAIALFGSLELSILDEMPKNRKPIITKIVPPTGRQEIYAFINNEINNGRQVFVIFPLVEESKAMTEVKAATTEHERLEKIFPQFKIGLMHGRLKAKEKELAMQAFKDRKTQILVSTSVVEVGIDIPNASVMIIEDADRFGLSQLHQFRGRVGRGEHQSYCFLFSSSVGNARLKALEENTDGFAIAEKDLVLRGPGQFFGTIQSGLPDIAMEHLANVNLIKHSRAEAQNLLKADPQLKKHPALQDALLKFSEKIHLE
ncbi:MAG: ATP-dependent DNA helicase RecG [Parcubacteria group bacterium]